MNAILYDLPHKDGLETKCNKSVGVDSCPWPDFRCYVEMGLCITAVCRNDYQCPGNMQCVAEMCAG